MPPCRIFQMRDNSAPSFNGNFDLPFKVQCVCGAPEKGRAGIFALSHAAFVAVRSGRQQQMWEPEIDPGGIGDMLRP